MNIKSLERIVFNRTDQFDEEQFNKNVAKVIRKKRKEANMTQSEIAAGICSISYISKIENGECPPDNFYVREVMSKMGITLDEVMISEYTSELYEMVDAVYYDDVHKVQLLLDLTEKADSIAAKLIQIVGRLYLEENVYDRLKYVNGYKNDLTDFELMVYLYCIAKHEASLLHYKKAGKCIEIILNFDEMNQHLQFLVFLLMVESRMRCGEYVSALHYWNTAKNYLSEGYEIHNVYRMNLLYAEIMIYTGEFKHAEEELSKFTKIHHERLEEKMFLLIGLVDYHKKEYSQAVISFLRAKNYFFEESILFSIRSLVQHGDAHQVLEYYKILEEGTNSIYFLKLGEYYRLQLEDNIYASREYINNHLLSNIKKYDYAYLNDEILQELIQFHRFNSRYKAVDELRSRLSIT